MKGTGQRGCQGQCWRWRKNALVRTEWVVVDEGEEEADQEEEVGGVCFWEALKERKTSGYRRELTAVNMACRAYGCRNVPSEMKD